MTCRTRQFLSPPSRTISGSSTDSCVSPSSPTTRTNGPSCSSTASLTLESSSSASALRQGSTSSSASALPSGAASCITTVESSTRDTEFASIASRDTTGKTCAFPNAAPSAVATSAPRDAAAMRTSVSWSDCSARYICSSGTRMSASSGCPPSLHPSATSASDSAAAMRTRHALSRVQTAKQSFSRATRVETSTFLQTGAVFLSALTRTDSCSSTRRPRYSWSSSLSTTGLP
mmetsp:Transcript_625/g.1878  ORF Transcript_625/g.1878 Transcript_625/m.1878 type:complete len:232 (+) Transcript_625:807-1502(+)